MFLDDEHAPRLDRPAWQHQFHWWGPPWQAPVPRTIAELVSLEMLTAEQAHLLVRHLHFGGSLLVAAMPQGAGKSTLAGALVAELPSDRAKVYIRGMYEPFDWLSGTDPQTATLLVNEISPHLPIYAWGETLRRLLALGEAGYQLVGTIHADTTDDLIAQLAAYPIHATAAQIAALDVVVFITVGVDGDNVTRRVGSILTLSLDPVTGGLIAMPVSL